MASARAEMDRRTFLSAAGATAALLAAGRPRAARGATVPSENLAISFWNGLTGPDGRIMETLTVQFTSQYPNIKIEQQQIPWNDFYTKMLTAIPAGDGPDMAIMHTYEIPRFADAGNITGITGAELQAQDLDPADFYQVAWEGGGYKGKRYALPLDVPSMGLYLNNTLFRAAGLWAGDRPKAPTNMAEFLATAKALTKGDQYGIAWPQTGVARWLFEMLLWQNGGDLFDEKGNPILDSPAAIEVAEFHRDLNKKHGVVPVGITNPLEAFRTGKFGMMVQGGWNIPALQAANMDFTLAPIPQWFKKKVVWASSHQFVLPPQGRRKDENRRKAALGFYGWLSKNSVAWAKAGHVVARRSIVRSPEFQALKHQVVLAGQEPYWKFQPATHKIIEVETRLPPTLEKIFLGTATPEQALKALNDEIRRIRI